MTTPVRRNATANHLLWAGVASLWTLPFLWAQHRYPLTALESELLAFLSLGLILLALGLLPAAPAPRRWPLPALLAALMPIAAAQYLLGYLVYLQQLLAVAWFTGSMLLAYLAGRRIVAGGLADRCVRLACRATVFGAVASVGIQWLQLLDVRALPAWLVVVIEDPSWRSRPYANLGQTNLLATYLGTAALAAACLHARGLRARGAAAVLVVLGTGLGMTGARLSLLYVVLGCTLLFVPNGLRPADRRARVMLALALGAGFAAGVGAIRTVVGSEWSMLARLAQDTYRIRIELFDQAWAVSWHSPLLGVGAGQFGAAQYWVARAGPYTQPEANCHNLLLQIAAEFGWPAAIATAGVGLWWGLSQLGARLARPEGAFVWSFMVLLAIHSMLEYPLWYLFYAVPAALMYGIGEPAPSAPVEVARPQRSFALAGAGALLLAAAAGTEFEYRPIEPVAERFWIEKGRMLPTSSATEAGVLAIAGSRWFRPQVERMLLSLQAPARQQGLEYLELSERVLSRMGQPEVIARHVILLAQAGRIPQAVLHAGRLRVFAGRDYPRLRDAIVRYTRPLGPAVEPLHAVLLAGDPPASAP